MNNPVIDYLDYYNNSCPNADYIHENGLFIGNDIRDLKENIDMVYDLINKPVTRLEQMETLTHDPIVD